MTQEIIHWHKLNTLPPPSHSLNRIAILDVISSRRNRLKYPMRAVRIAKDTASATPWSAKCFRLKAATCRLNFITNAPYRPCRTKYTSNQSNKGSSNDSIPGELTPKIPRTTKKMISKKCQSLSYVTWNNTSFPVLNGFIAYQNKLNQGYHSGKRH
jgi:hypothetical protein